MQDHLSFAGIPLTRMRGAVPAWRARIPLAKLRNICETAHAKGGRLATLWGTGEKDGDAAGLWVVLVVDDALLWFDVALASDAQRYPDLSDIFPAAARMQRGLHDLLGIAHEGTDQRPWLRHSAWPEGDFPLRADFRFNPSNESTAAPYAFVHVVGDGVHEIPVGPVHAGIIEPGQFRFSVVGEKVLRLEERLGFTHRGIDKRWEHMDAREAVRIAGRVSGDSTVAYAWAYAMALEAIADAEVPPRAQWLRALLLERERVANHLGDLGALGNDGGLAVGLAQFMRLKEDVLRLNQALFGHRYAMDLILPGGVSVNFDRYGAETICEQCDVLQREVTALKQIYDDHAGLQDRFLNCGILSTDVAGKLGVIGLAGRASGQAWDARVKPGYEPYDSLGIGMHTHPAGDVAARVALRFEELFESLRLVRQIVDALPLGRTTTSLQLPAGRHRGVGRVEGWRGEALLLLETDSERVRVCHAHDPSWQNWPAIEYAVIGNIVPDFPLINKSFNLSYAGHDL